SRVRAYCVWRSLSSSVVIACPRASGLAALSLHDALPICRDGAPPGRRARPHDRDLRGCRRAVRRRPGRHPRVPLGRARDPRRRGDRKSTRLNSSHVKISYAVFCLKKKKMTGQSEHNRKEITALSTETLARRRGRTFGRRRDQFIATGTWRTHVVQA